MKIETVPTLLELTWRTKKKQSGLFLFCCRV